MKKVVVVSLFRNRAQFVPQFIKQIEEQTFRGELHVVCVENNSTDRTRQMLERWRFKNKHIIGEESNDPLFGSIISQERFAVLGKVANLGLDYAYSLEPDYILFIESDLIFTPDLIDTLISKRKDVVAPMIWTRQDVFYDILAFVNLDGTAFPPHRRQWYQANYGKGLLEVASAGSCLLVNTKVIKAARFGENAIMSYCEAARQEGKVFVDRDSSVWHP